MRSEHHDVIVVGAGPSGASVAGALVAAGRTVLMIDSDAQALGPVRGVPMPMFRLRTRDLGRLEHFEGGSPAWPIEAEEMARWYALAEDSCRVRGCRATDPTEPLAGRPLPQAAESADPAVLAALHRFRAAGLQPFPTPVGSPPAGAPAGCDVVAGTVVRVETDGRGLEARAVIVQRAGYHTRYTADAVVLAAGAVGSAAILLRSATDAHPHGLANASGIVGRNLVRRTFGLVLALMKREPPVDTEPGFTINDFYLASPGWRYPAGHVRLIGSTHRQVADTGSPYPGPHGARAAHSLDFLLAAEGLPDSANRVDVGRGGELTVHWRPTNGTALRKLSAQMRHTLTAVGSACVQAPLSMHPAAAARLHGESGCGTVRMGTDPSSSAVRPDGRAHDVVNLWVADASTFPSAGALDPALTQVAFGLRAAASIDAALGGRLAAGSADRAEGWAA